MILHGGFKSERKHQRADNCILFYVLIPGIVTRRPLVLQLNKIEEGQQDYAQFLHTKSKKFTDFCMSFYRYILRFLLSGLFYLSIVHPIQIKCVLKGMF